MANKYHKSRRQRAFSLYGEVCMCCGKTKEHGVSMQADHIFPQCSHGEYQRSFLNYQVLCNNCNKAKSWNFIKDYRFEKRNWNRYSEEAKLYLTDNKIKIDSWFKKQMNKPTEKGLKLARESRARIKRNKEMQDPNYRGAGSKPIPKWLQ